MTRKLIILAVVSVVAIAAGVGGYVLLGLPGIGGDATGGVGLLVIVERLSVVDDVTARSILLVENGVKVCTDRQFCPPVLMVTVSFRLTIETGITADGDWEAPVRLLSTGTWTIDIPDDTKTVTTSLEAGFQGYNLAPNATRNVLSSPFESTSWTITHFEFVVPVDGRWETLSGNLTYSVVAADGPFSEDYSQGSSEPYVWPIPLTPGGTMGRIGISTTQSPDGTNWVLTFVDVPVEVRADSITISIGAKSGIWLLLPGTALLSLIGGDATYVPIDATPFIGVGDIILLSVSEFPAGSQYELLSDDIEHLVAGTLR